MNIRELMRAEKELRGNDSRSKVLRPRVRPSPKGTGYESDDEGGGTETDGSASLGGSKIKVLSRAVSLSTKRSGASSTDREPVALNTRRKRQRKEESPIGALEEDSGYDASAESPGSSVRQKNDAGVPSWLSRVEGETSTIIEEFIVEEEESKSEMKVVDQQDEEKSEEEYKEQVDDSFERFQDLVEYCKNKKTIKEEIEPRQLKEDDDDLEIKELNFDWRSKQAKTS